MAVLEVDQLTKDYGNGRGVFDVSFGVEKGEVFGFLGPNGAGKTTTIRHILGFSRPDKGSTRVDGLDSWNEPAKIQLELGYLPGEMALPNDMTGIQLIRQIAQMRKMSDMTRAEHLIRRFGLDPTGSLKRMSKGMKQKIGIVCAFMHNPQILILDEPTSGLDPLMQNAFVDLIREEKEAGKTVLMSSHMFEEVEKTCDCIAIIKDGKLISTIEADELRHARQKVYKLEFPSSEQYERFIDEPLDFVERSAQKRQAKVSVRDDEINAFIGLLSHYELKYLTEVRHTLEEYFMRFYGGDQLD